MRRERLYNVATWLESGHPLQASRIVYADIVCDLMTCEVTRGKRLIQLTRREFDLMCHFMRHPRRVLPRGLILRSVWGYDGNGDTKVVDVYVGYLRRKLGKPLVLQTLRGFGYALRA